MAIGIINTFVKTADTAVASSTALVPIGLTSPIAAGQTQHIRAWIPITVGAAGGVRLQVVVPSGGTAFIASITLNNTVAPSQTIAAQSSSAAFTNALANAGTHWLIVEATVVNGSNAGDVDIQMAQNTSDNTPMTALRGGFMEVVKL